MDTPEPQLRHCYECETDYPLTEKNFRVNNANSPPFDELCKKCRRRNEKDRRERAKPVIDLMAKIEGKSVDRITEELLVNSNNIPHSAELLESILQAFGGVDSFGRLFAAHFWQSDPGKAQRTKMLTAVMGLIVKNVEQGGAKKPLDMWTEEELEAELEKKVKTLRIAHVQTA